MEDRQAYTMKSIRILGTLPIQTSFKSSSIRTFSTSTILGAPKVQSKTDVAAKKKAQKKRKRFTSFQMPNLKDLTQYSLCDAMQYIQAFEVGRNGRVSKYDLAIRLKTKKDGPVLRNQIKLPHAVKTDIRVCALVDPESRAGKQAKAAGATIIGLEDVFTQIKEGKIDFERCITTPEYLPVVAKAGMPRILGPRGLMPSAKLGTVTEKVAESVGSMMGGSAYRERDGVVRMAIAQLAHSPEQVRDNIKRFLDKLKKEASILSDNSNMQKEVFEVVSLQHTLPCYQLTLLGFEFDTLTRLFVEWPVQIIGLVGTTGACGSVAVLYDNVKEPNHSNVQMCVSSSTYGSRHVLASETTNSRHRFNRPALFAA